MFMFIVIRIFIGAKNFDELFMRRAFVCSANKRGLNDQGATTTITSHFTYGWKDRKQRKMINKMEIEWIESLFPAMSILPSTKYAGLNFDWMCNTSHLPSNSHIFCLLEFLSRLVFPLQMTWYECLLLLLLSFVLVGIEGNAITERVQ